MEKIKKLTVEEKDKLLSKTFFVLPDNPSTKNFSASQIKKKGYEGLLVLFEHINNLIDSINGNADINNKEIADINKAIDTINKQIKDILFYNQNQIALRALADEDGDHFKSVYGKSLSGNSVINEDGASLTINLLNKLSEIVSTLQLEIPMASTTTSGLLTAIDKAKIDTIATDIATSLSQAKTYTDSKVAKDELMKTIGLASTTLSGLMSKEDKANLDTLMEMLGDENGDSDKVVNTIREILSIFDSYPEGTSIVSALAGKLDKSDVYNGLDSESTAKALSAKQGSVLKGAIDALNTSKADKTEIPSLKDYATETWTTSQLTSYVPKTRKVNNKSLDADISLSKADFGLGSVINTGDSDTPVENGLTKFTTGGAYKLKQELQVTITSKLDKGSESGTAVEQKVYNPVTFLKKIVFGNNVDGVEIDNKLISVTKQAFEGSGDPDFGLYIRPDKIGIVDAIGGSSFTQTKDGVIYEWNTGGSSASISYPKDKTGDLGDFLTSKNDKVVLNPTGTPTSELSKIKVGTAGSILSVLTHNELAGSQGGWEYVGRVAQQNYTIDLSEIKPGHSGTTTGAKVYVDIHTFKKALGDITQYKTVLDVTCRTNPFELKHIDLKALLSNVGSKWFFPRVLIPRGSMQSANYNHMMQVLYADRVNVGMSFDEISIFRDMTNPLGNLNASGGVLPIGGMNADGFSLFAVMMELDRDNEGKNITVTGSHHRVTLFHPNPVMWGNWNEIA